MFIILYRYIVPDLAVNMPEDHDSNKIKQKNRKRGRDAHGIQRTLRFFADFFHPARDNQLCPIFTTIPIFKMPENLSLLACLN